MTVAILSLGTELTRGEIVNGNATWLAERLTELGYEVTEITTLGDEDEHIEAALERLGKTARLIVCTGGLGPTTDDRTSACVARVLGVPLSLNSRAWTDLKALLERRGRTLGPENEKQAFFPEGATVLHNELGTAPGFAVTLPLGARAFFMPGVPSEMRAMFEKEVQPHLEPPNQSWLVLHLRTFGMPESEVGQRLAQLEETYGVVVGYRASAGGVHVKVHVRTTPSSLGEARHRAQSAWLDARERLGSAVFGSTSAPLEQVFGELLRKKGLSLGLAESCTGGGASELMTRMPGSSSYFRGAVVAYDNRVKASVLGVPQPLLDTHGAVSREVAEAMAQGACRALGADVGVSITGIAGPDGGTKDKPVGTVHWAVVHRGRTAAFQARFSGTRVDVQRRATHAALFSAWQLVHDESSA
jgi:nicotinamide-nucleotide amidase